MQWRPDPAAAAADLDDAAAERAERGTISDSATVSSGVSPPGSVTFKLFGPGDATCTDTPISTTIRTLVGRSASSGNVTAGAVGTYNWVATYGGDANNTSVTSACGSEQALVTPPHTLTDRAYGLSAMTSLVGIPRVNVKPTPDTGPISTTSSSTTQSRLERAAHVGRPSH